MHRRELLRTLAASAVVAALPRTLRADDVWRTLAPRGAGALSPAQLDLVGAIADVILPRTDTPSATDVGVPAFVDVIITGYDGEEERRAFLDGLDAIEALAQRTSGRGVTQLAAGDRAALVQRLDAATPRTTPAERTYGRLKGLVIHGYFTSERVQRDVLAVPIAPGRFDGAAPHVVPARAGGSDA